MKKVRFFSVVAVLAYAIIISIVLLACGDAQEIDPRNTLGDPIKGPIRVDEH